MVSHANSARLWYRCIPWITVVLLPALSVWAQIPPVVSDGLAGHQGGTRAGGEAMATVGAQVYRTLRVKSFSLSRVEALPE